MTDEIVKAIVAILLQLIQPLFKRQRREPAAAPHDHATAISDQVFGDTEKIAVGFLGAVAILAVLGLVFTLSTSKTVV